MRRYNPSHARSQVTVSTAGQPGPRGPVHAAPVQVRCRFVLAQKLTRAADGTDVAATAELHASPEVNPGKDLRALFTPGSTVAHAGVTRRVVAVEEAVNRGRLVYLAVTLA